MSLQSFPIVGLVKGVQTNVKPAMLPDQAWAILYNAYTYRERELKREGRQLLGRLQRNLISQSLGNTPAGPPNTVTILDIFTNLSITEPQAELVRGTLVITVGAPDAATFTDLGNGNFSVTGKGVAAGSFIDYQTGEVVLQFTSLTGGAAITATFSYYPTLPVMGTITRDISTINDEQTIWFDTRYAYVWSGTNFEEFIPGTTWAGSDSDFFWGFNYRGASAAIRLLFVTNDVPDAADPMRYTDGSTWTTFAPIATLTPSSITIFQARIIIAYYGRLLLLNTWEGPTGSGAAGASNFFNRCRFSQLGDPTAATAYRTDIFGKGGLIDAPTNEAITGATFIKNTLVVDFERTTWQLRYVGEYGLPFIWERISSDFGSESTFSGVLFDNYRLAVGDKGITQANGTGVNRIDLLIPDTVFDFNNENNGPKRVAGIRDFKRELVFWNYPDSQTEASATEDTIFPNRVLVYNYRNETWAIFRDSITSFGTFQSSFNITWDSTTIFWDSETVFWDDPDTQSLFPLIVAGNQQGYVSCYGYPSPSQLSTVNANDQETLTIEGITTNSGFVVIESVNHGLENFDIVYLNGIMFLDNSTHLPVATTLNGIYQVSMQSFNTKDNFSLMQWNFSTKNYEMDFTFTPTLSGVTYIGGGQITLFPKLNVLSKDINLFQGKSLQTKLSRLDFLFQSVPQGQVSVKLFLNASAIGSTPGVVGQNNLVWEDKLSIDAKPPFYTPGSDYAWFRYYATLAAQYFSINITYDDDQMNTLATHSQDCTLYAINAWCRPGGKNAF